MEPHHRGRLPLLEVALYRFADVDLEALEIVSFRENTFTQRLRGVTALGRLFDYKNEFFHDNPAVPVADGNIPESGAAGKRPRWSILPMIK